MIHTTGVLIRLLRCSKARQIPQRVVTIAHLRVVARRHRRPNLVDDRVQADSARIARTRRACGRRQLVPVEIYRRRIQIVRAKHTRSVRQLNNALLQSVRRHRTFIGLRLREATAFKIEEEKRLATQNFFVRQRPAQRSAVLVLVRFRQRRVSRTVRGRVVVLPAVGRELPFSGKSLTVSSPAQPARP